MIFGTEAFEIQILKSIHSFFECGFMDFIMPFFSALGNGGMLWIAIAVILIFTKKYRRCGFLILVCMLLGLLIGNLTLKPLIARPRPSWTDTGFPLLISNPTDFSHPSGHTLSSFIAAFVMLKTDKRLGIPAIITACIIAFSRLYLFVHFPTDILAGILLAWLITLPFVRKAL